MTLLALVAADLELAVLSRLGDGYPNLKLILVDDRSTDGTGAIAHLENEQADHLSVMPDMRARTFLVGVMQAMFLRLAVAAGRLASVANPRSIC